MRIAGIRWTVLVLVFEMVLSLGACGEKEYSPESSEAVKPTAAPTETKETVEKTTAITTEPSAEETSVPLETESTAAEKPKGEEKKPTQPPKKEESKPTQAPKQETTPPQTESPEREEPKPTAPPQTEPPATQPPRIEPPQTEPPAKKAVVTAEALAGIKAGFLRLVNEERARAGAGSLIDNSYLDSCAKIRSNEIKGCWSHTRPDGTDFYTVIDGNAYPYIRIGENIGSTSYLGMQEFTQDDLFIGTDEQIAMACQSIFELFRYSPPHYANMIQGEYTDCGIGIDYFINEESGMPIFTVAHIFGAC